MTNHPPTSASSGRPAVVAVAVALAIALVAMVLIGKEAVADKQPAPTASSAGGPPGPGWGEALRSEPGDGGEATSKKRGKGRGSKRGRRRRGSSRLQTPNVVMVMTDDQAPSTMNPTAMPNLFSRLVPRATSFTDYISSSPLCCPARAGFMTGQYGHNNGVLRNFYRDLKGKRNVLPQWLRNAGYRTAHVGKFLNGYEQGRLGPAAVAPGWDYWFTQLEKRRYYRWKASINGQVHRFGIEDSDHLTTVTNEYAAHWASKLARKRAPFYLQVDYFAPHGAAGREGHGGPCRGSGVPEPIDEGRFAAAPLPRPPSFNQPDVSKMPDHVRNRPLLDAEDIEAVTRRYRCALESVYGVDRGIGMILDAIDKRGELSQTVFIFTTDNGYFYGEHRIPKGKPGPYEENLRIPMYMRIPAKYRDRAELVPQSGASVANIDLAPTILELAEANPCRKKGHCRRMDGRSLMPLLNGDGGFPSSRAIEVRLNDCNYRGVRMDRTIYLAFFRETATGCEQFDAEMYNLNADPYQLNNLLPPRTAAATGLRDRLLAKMNRLSSCSGIRRRDKRRDGMRFCE